MNELWYVGLEVDEQVRRFYEGDHGVVDVEVALVVAVVDMTAVMQVCCKNMRVFVDGSVLDYRFSAFADLSDLVEPAVEEVYL